MYVYKRDPFTDPGITLYMREQRSMERHRRVSLFIFLLCKYVNKGEREKSAGKRARWLPEKKTAATVQLYVTRLCVPLILYARTYVYTYACTSAFTRVTTIWHK